MSMSDDKSNIYPVQENLSLREETTLKLKSLFEEIILCQSALVAVKEHNLQPFLLMCMCKERHTAAGKPEQNYALTAELMVVTNNFFWTTSEKAEEQMRKTTALTQTSQTSTNA